MSNAKHKPNTFRSIVVASDTTIVRVTHHHSTHPLIQKPAPLVKVQCHSVVRQYVIVMRGRFTAWESLVLDPDIMVEVCINIKE